MRNDGPSTVPWRGLALGSAVVWCTAGSIATVVSMGADRQIFGPLDTASLARVAAEAAGFALLFAALFNLAGFLAFLGLGGPRGPAGGCSVAGTGGCWGEATWRAKWANRTVAGAHGVLSSCWAAGALWVLLSGDYRDGGTASVRRQWLPVAYDLPRYGHGHGEPLGWWVGGVVEFTLAYSCYDLAYMILLEPGLAFMLHHVAILGCFAPLFLNGGRGFVVAVVGILVAEVGNPLLGVWTWSKELLKAHDAQLAASLSPAWKERLRGGSEIGGGQKSPPRSPQKVPPAAAAAGIFALPSGDVAYHRATFGRLALPVTLAYVLMRGVVMPLSVIDVVLFLDFPGGKADPGLAWMWVHCVAGFLGSAAWISMLVGGYVKFAAKSKKSGRKADDKARKSE